MHQPQGVCLAQTDAALLIVQLQPGSDVHFCVTQGHGVFPDLRNDEYSAAPLSVASNCAQHEDAPSAQDLARILHEHVDPLLAAGLLAYGIGPPRLTIGDQDLYPAIVASAVGYCMAIQLAEGLSWGSPGARYTVRRACFPSPALQGLPSGGAAVRF